VTDEPKYSRSINRWIAAALKKLDAPDLIGKVNWVYNPNLTSTMGYVRLYHILDWHLVHRIEFSPELFRRARPEQRRQTVYHEVAHVVDGWRGTYNPKKPHGRSWKGLMRTLGIPAKRCHDVPVVGRGC
jgi:hypothetical protein